MRLQDGKCCLTQFFCVRNHSEPAISVLQAIAHALLSFCSGETVLEISTVMESASALAEYLLPEERTAGYLMRATLPLA